MNRRNFLQRVVGMPVATVSAAAVLTAATPNAPKQISIDIRGACFFDDARSLRNICDAMEHASKQRAPR